MRRCHLKVFLLLALEQNNFSNFGRGSPKEHFCEIILKSGYWPMRRCHLKVFQFLALERNNFSNFGRGSPRKLFFEIGPLAYLEILFKVFFLFLALAAILFSGEE